MSWLTADVVRKSYAFAIVLDDPLKTLEELLHFFSERRIVVDALQMQSTEQLEANLIVHAQIEKDRIRYTIDLMKRIPGIIKLVWFECKG